MKLIGVWFYVCVFEALFKDFFFFVSLGHKVVLFHSGIYFLYRSGTELGGDFECLGRHSAMFWRHLDCHELGG